MRGWQRCADPVPMLRSLVRRATAARLGSKPAESVPFRAFALASCCRARGFLSEQFTRILERWVVARGTWCSPLASQTRDAALTTFRDITRRHAELRRTFIPRTSDGNDLLRLRVEQLATEAVLALTAPLPQHAARLAQSAAARAISLHDYLGRWPARTPLVRLRAAWDFVSTDELRAQADLLRDIVGSPTSPVVLDRSWRTSTTIGLARSMIRSQDFSGMPILADALQEAGCDSAAVLSHSRQPSEHASGCWLLRLLDPVA